MLLITFKNAYSRFFGAYFAKIVVLVFDIYKKNTLHWVSQSSDVNPHTSVKLVVLQIIKIWLISFRTHSYSRTSSFAAIYVLFYSKNQLTLI